MDCTKIIFMLSNENSPVGLHLATQPLFFIDSSDNILITQLGVRIHDMQQASRKAEPGDYKHAMNDM